MPRPGASTSYAGACSPNIWARGRTTETEHLFRMIETPSFHTTTRPQTRYVRSGDAYLAYQTIGEGPMDLLHFGGFISHIEQLWEEPELARFYHQLGNSRVSSFMISEGWVYLIASARQLRPLSMSLTRRQS